MLWFCGLCTFISTLTINCFWISFTSFLLFSLNQLSVGQHWPIWILRGELRLRSGSLMVDSLSSVVSHHQDGQTAWNSVSVRGTSLFRLDSSGFLPLQCQQHWYAHRHVYSKTPFWLLAWETKTPSRPALGWTRVSEASGLQFRVCQFATKCSASWRPETNYSPRVSLLPPNLSPFSVFLQNL